MHSQTNTDKPLEIYKNSKSYQEIVRRRYNINDLGLLYDDKILLLIYAYEWFSIKENDLYNKVCYHPYLTVKDKKYLDSIYENQKNIFYIQLVPFYFSLYIFKRKYIKVSIRKSFKPLATIYSLGLIYPIISWMFLISYSMNEHIKQDNKLQNYFNLDVDRTKIQKDLLNFNIVL
jgi:hypothetical protein